jgi:hypothetical protein
MFHGTISPKKKKKKRKKTNEVIRIHSVLHSCLHCLHEEA